MRGEPISPHFFLQGLFQFIYPVFYTDTSTLQFGLPRNIFRRDNFSKKQKMRFCEAFVSFTNVRFVLGSLAREFLD